MNKSQKKQKCRDILHKYPINSEVTNQEDIDFLLSVFESHSEWESKKGVGVKFISVILTKYKNRCFVLNRIDGTSTDISFNHSIKNRSKIDEIKQSCRSAIQYEKIKFRDNNVIYGKSKCPFTGEVLYKENTHVDHYNLTFNELFIKWLRSYDVDFLYKNINETTDNNFQTYFTNQGIIEDFIKFHNNNTNLRIISKTANLSL